ncbi:hypothetical protein [Streptomyces silvensis]|uniref:Uncharacterized protein n=1 Tax=Streptomyces silvensis TaxID=1765722 RepID=A0A0W7WXE9_9ACTN|nr:hypothetical protein [Streptomyces silvensis]KUF15250.1 hypothetical protein AT728_39195 [Streptomyces silvensis]
MTGTIDELLARARLQDETDTPVDPVRMPRPGTAAAPGRRPSTVAGHAHLAAAVPAPATGPLGPPGPLGATAAAGRSGGADSTSQDAVRDLRNLCEAVVTAGSLASLRAFLTRVLPEPPGARVIGCILQLNGAEESARFWWQYAAGAGDAAASYCLHLHHASLGERDEAVWWRAQTPGASEAPDTSGHSGGSGAPGAPGHSGGSRAAGTSGHSGGSGPDAGLPEPGFPRDHPPVRTDRSVPTMLRVLGRLKVSDRVAGPYIRSSDHCARPSDPYARPADSHHGAADPYARSSDPYARPPVVRVVMDYVASAVDYVDPDLELPLPCADFTDHIRILTTPAARPAPRSTASRRPLAVRARPVPHAEAG